MPTVFPGIGVLVMADARKACLQPGLYAAIQADVFVFLDGANNPLRLCCVLSTFRFAQA